MTSHFLSYAWGNAHDSDFCQTYRALRPGGIPTDRISPSIEFILQLTSLHFRVFAYCCICRLSLKCSADESKEVLYHWLDLPPRPQASDLAFSLQNGQVWHRCLWRISGSHAFEHWRLRKNILVIVSYMEARFTDGDRKLSLK